ncbi:MAG: lysophospholipid acyltransferase family protein [Candidatus Omnitrophica bacterium]|nr:lysophospholipid acyltransferase family protein [Candidatus Omnitrophota bacterium]
MFYYIARTICSLFFKICFRYKVCDRENLPNEGAYIIASNHVSLLDPVAVGLLVRRRVSFVAREDLFRNKIFGFILRQIGVIPLHRNRQDIKAIREALRRIREGGVLAIFPEGTRSRDGSIGNFLSGIEVLARAAQAKVVPVYLKDTNLALPRTAYFIRLKRIRALVGEVIEPELFCNKDSSGVLIQKVRDEMQRLKNNTL